MFVLLGLNYACLGVGGVFVFACVDLGWFALGVLVVWSLWLYVCVVVFCRVFNVGCDRCLRLFVWVGLLKVCLCLSVKEIWSRCIYLFV